MLDEFEKQFQFKVERQMAGVDPAHDILHFKRVVRTAKQLAIAEKAKLEVVVPAAWLHDLVWIAKDDPRRAQASQLSANAAIQYLADCGYPERHFQEIAHAIEAHSFSAEVRAKTLEAKVVQDADRLDGLGAIGIARCFATSGLLRRTFYSENDPLCAERTPDDARFAVDHFFKKLFKVAQTLHTDSGRKEGQRRVEVMQIYMKNLEQEIL